MGCLLNSTCPYVNFLPDIQDIQDVVDPLTKVEAGLRGNNGQPVPLKAVHIRAKLLDLVAQVQQIYILSKISDLEILCHDMNMSIKKTHILRFCYSGNYSQT